MKQSLLFFLLLSLWSCQADRIPDVMAASMQENRTRAIELIDESTDLTLRQLRYRLQDDSKLYYRGILPTVDSIVMMVDAFRKQTLQLEENATIEEDAMDKLPQLASAYRQAKEDIFTYTANYLNTSKDTLGLNKDQIASRITHFRKEMFQNRENYAVSTTWSSKIITMWVSDLILNLVSDKAMLIRNLAALTDGRMLCGGVFIPTAHRITLNDSSSNHIAIFLQSSDWAPKAKGIHLYINGKKHVAYSGVYAFYADTLSTPIDTLSITGEYFNALIGVSGSLFGPSPYRIKVH